MRKLLIVITLVLFSFTVNAQKARIKAIAEIRQAESAFQKMAEEKGVREAFVYFSASDVVVNRNDVIIKGRDSLAAYMGRSRMQHIKLCWKPDFADASDDGTLGYTYGSYTYSATEPSGKVVKSSGVFHTVWRKQKDGRWKFVWD